MKVGADKRSRDVERAPEAEQAAREGFAEFAAVEVRVAKALATIERTRSYLFSEFASVHQWAAAAGYGPAQTRRLLVLGRTLLDVPELEERVAKGAVPAETAGHIGRLFREPTLALSPEDRAEWLRRAEEEDPRKVREDVEEAIENARQGAPTLPIGFRVTRQTRDDLERVRLLLADKQGPRPTRGQAVGVVLGYWLERNDPARKPLPKRRSRRRTRKVSARVRAEIERRSQRRCEICGCRPATEFAHLRPWAKGAGNEVHDLVYACSECHVFLDAGIFRFDRFDDAGRPRFQFDHDRLHSLERAQQVRERAPPPYRASRRPRPAVMATGPPG